MKTNQTITEEESSFQEQLIAMGLAITGIFLFSSKAVLVKLIYQVEVDSVTVLLLRMLFSLPIFLIIAVIHSYKNPMEEKVGNKIIFQIIILGIVGYYMASFFDFQGLKYISASLERLILFVYPTIVVILSAIFLKKKITRQQVFAILLTYFGMVVIFSNFLMDISKNTNEAIFQGGILIFLSALTYAIYLIGSGQILPKIGTVRFTTYAMLVSCICVIIHYLVTQKNYEVVFDLPFQVYALSLAMAIFATVIPSYLISESIRRIGASKVSLLGSLGPVSTIGLSMIFLGESLTINQFIGAFFVIGGVILISKKK